MKKRLIEVFTAGCPLCETIPRRSLPVRTGLFEQASLRSLLVLGRSTRGVNAPESASFNHFCHSGMVREHQTRNLEIPGSRFACPGMTR